MLILSLYRNQSYGCGTLQPIFAVWLNSESILLALKQDPEVSRLAALYLKYLSLGLPAYAVNNITRFVVDLRLFLA